MHHNELSLLVSYEEMKHINKDMAEFVLDKVLDFDLGEIHVHQFISEFLDLQKY